MPSLEGQEQDVEVSVIYKLFSSNLFPLEEEGSQTTDSPSIIVGGCGIVATISKLGPPSG